ncbi:MAG: hypothetical protein FJW20_21610 [Acidimicrobiia bacterium]|nr:hypothetical protein [Acidimicrobiia bacterium]
MAQGKPSKRKQLEKLLEGERPAVVNPALAAAWKRQLDPISANYFRRLLRESGAALHPLVEGVRQQDFDELERTLVALLQEYLGGAEQTRRECRRLVIEAKDHARLAMRKADEAGRALKEEMVQWMLVWLENPPVFVTWAGLRRRQLTESRSFPPG